MLSRMKKLVIFLGGIVTILALAFYVGQSRPDMLARMLTVVDVLGVTETGATEKTRISTIMNLPIAYEKKQALVARTIFMGATTEMMLLAFGPPKEKTPSPDVANTETWKYHFPGDTRPTVFRVENSILMSACKGSAVD